MIVYSKKIIKFASDIKEIIREVLAKEIRLRVHGERFYDRAENYSYPIKVVIFNNQSTLGYFDADFLELGFNECLMHKGLETLRNVIRHELAHYITFINYGISARPHSGEFKAFCQRMGWGEEVYAAALSLEESVSELGDESVLRKVQKLMALSTSSNRNEAEQAMIKSQQLLLKHNMESRYIGKEEERSVLKRIMKQSKKDARMESIAHILETFFVTIVYNRGGGSIVLEILGSQVNVEIAEYVAGVLQGEMDKLWGQAQQNCYLRGTVARNSFFRGLAKGYCDKINALKKAYNQETAQALMVIEKKLVDVKEMVYPRLTSMRSSGGYSREAASLGEQMGRHLNINPALSQKNATIVANLIDYV